MKATPVILTFSIFLVSCSNLAVSPTSSPSPTATFTLTPSATPTVTATLTATPTEKITPTATPTYFLPNGDSVPEGTSLYFDAPYKEGQNRSMISFSDCKGAQDFINNVTGIADFSLSTLPDERKLETISLDWNKLKLHYSAGLFWMGTNKQVIFTVVGSPDGTTIITYRDVNRYSHALHLDAVPEDVLAFFQGHGESC